MSMDCDEEALADDFSLMDARRLCRLILRQQAQTDKKRKWLAAMISEPGVDRISRKRPKFLKDDYLAESDIRSDEVSSDRVKANVERSFGLQSNCYNHHIVQDGVLLFELLKGKGGPICPESLRVMLCTISKLSNAALHSVATIATYKKLVFKKSRVSMKKIIGEHLPKYMAKLDKEDSGRQLYKILTNPCSYLSDSVRLTTPVTPTLLSSVDQSLVDLDKMSEQALVAMNRKLREAPRTPKFLHESRFSTKSRVVRIVRKRCEKIIEKLVEGVDLPENLAKALSIMNLYWKAALRSMDISQSEFFPFSRGTISVQNHVLHALWSLQEVSSNCLKLLRPILGQGSKKGSKISTASFRVYVRRYLTECLFECDGSKLPDKALRTIAFLIRMPPKQHQVIFTEEKKEEEVEAVLNLSSCLRSLARSETEECLNDDEVSLESDIGSEDTDFVFTETNYFNVRSQQQMDEGCCSNFMTVEDSEDPGSAGQYRDNEASGSTVEANLEDNVKTSRCSEDLSAVCDETASVAYKLIGEILKNILLKEEEVDELTGRYLGEDCTSQDSQVTENKKADIVMNAVHGVLPNLPKSCMDKARRILDGGEQ